uniref:PARG helical domain-containing protein n=1 Tax=Hucho hucho TaxID=62062 RepID=A0A4W5R8R4_9TELE
MSILILLSFVSFPLASSKEASLHAMEGQQHGTQATSLSQQNNPKSQQNNLDKWLLNLSQSTTSPASDMSEAAEQQLDDVEMVSPDSSESGCSHKFNPFQSMETETEAQTHSSDSEEPVVSTTIDLEDEETAPLTPTDSLKDHKPVSQITTDHNPVSQVATDHKPVSQVATDHKPVSQVTTHHRPVSQITIDHKPVSQVTTDHKPVSQVTTDHKPVSQVTTDHKPVSEDSTDHKPVSEDSTGHKPVSQVTTDPKGNSDEQTEETVSQSNRELDKQQVTERSSKGKGKITDFFAPSTSSHAPLEKQHRDGEDVPPPSPPNDSKWLGSPISDLRRMPQCGRPLPPLKNAPDHTVMIRTDLLQTGKIPVPYPNKFRDTWDEVHVKMPCSKSNLFPVGNQEVQERWELIQKALNRDFCSSHDVKNAILKYNVAHAKRWDFTALHLFCNKDLEPDAVDHLFGSLLPEMVQLALSVSELCSKPMPLLKEGMNHSITLSQVQVASLLANAFFCTFPRRNSRKSEYFNYPDINFCRLYEGSSPKKREKLKTLLCYFRSVIEQKPTGLVTFTRKCLDRPPNWKNSQNPLTKLHITCAGTIEDDGHGMLQVRCMEELTYNSI